MNGVDFKSTNIHDLKSMKFGSARNTPRKTFRAPMGGQVASVRIRQFTLTNEDKNAIAT